MHIFLFCFEGNSQQDNSIAEVDVAVDKNKQLSKMIKNQASALNLPIKNITDKVPGGVPSVGGVAGAANGLTGGVGGLAGGLTGGLTGALPGGLGNDATNLACKFCYSLFMK